MIGSFVNWSCRCHFGILWRHLSGGTEEGHEEAVRMVGVPTEIRTKPPEYFSVSLRFESSYSITIYKTTQSRDDSNLKANRRSEFSVPTDHVMSLSLSIIPIRTWHGSQRHTTYIKKPCMNVAGCLSTGFYVEQTHLTGCSQRSRIFGHHLHTKSLENTEGWAVFILHTLVQFRHSTLRICETWNLHM